MENAGLGLAHLCAKAESGTALWEVRGQGLFWAGLWSCLGELGRLSDGTKREVLGQPGIRLSEPLIFHSGGSRPGNLAVLGRPQFRPA